MTYDEFREIVDLYIAKSSTLSSLKSLIRKGLDYPGEKETVPAKEQALRKMEIDMMTWLLKWGASPRIDNIGDATLSVWAIPLALQEEIHYKIQPSSRNFAFEFVIIHYRVLALVHEAKFELRTYEWTTHTLPKGK